MQTLPIAAAGIGLLLVASQGRAQNYPVVVEGGIPTALVSYADLDLTSTAGRRALNGRVTRAASGLCLQNLREPIDSALAERECFSVAMTRARIQIEDAVARAGARFASDGTIRVAAR